LLLGPRYRDLSLVRDITVVYNFAQCHYKNSDLQVGIATTQAEAAKC